MKTISGVVITSKPVSLSKAAKVLRKFAFSDNGASPAFVAYLKLTSDSFQEHPQLRRKLLGSDSGRKSRKHHSRNRYSTYAQIYSEDATSVADKEDGAWETKRIKIKTKVDRDSEVIL